MKYNILMDFKILSVILCLGFCMCAYVCVCICFGLSFKIFHLTVLFTLVGTRPIFIFFH